MFKFGRGPCETRTVRRGSLHNRSVIATVCLAALASSAPAFAEGPTPDALDTPQSDLRITAEPTGQWTGVWTRETLLGDMGGLRSALGGLGITVGINETNEILGNLTGGTSKGYTYDGLTTMVVQLDTKQAFGWEGGTFNVSGLQIHGRNFSEAYLSSLNTASGIEADAGTRLWELWYQQSFFEKKADIKIGQQSIDQEFMTSIYSATFINTMFGWPGVPSYDMPSGGPAYPLSGLGVRLRTQLTPALTALFGVFAGDPSGNREDTHGTNFSLSGGTMFIGELQYSINQPAEGEMDMGTSSAGLPGTYKIGAWYNNGSFADQRYDTNGVPLADPASNGIGAPHHGNYSFYAVADQMVWQPDPGEARALGVFARVMYAPTDQNLVRASANLGVTLKAPFKGRDNDTAGLALAYIKVSDQVHGFDQDFASFNPGTFAPLRSSETVLEATYQYQLTPWWVLQADAQYTWNPGGGIVNPNDPTQKIKNEFVLGLRTTINF
ncbi:carbohydrate porin [Pararobbsia alpina]|uniref:Porin B n=1 Tax=Pararobbsia alpina TaxID=621374 RepID=A0A6S7C3Y1_9BURK|nr:carbohydrate porin [Pararobbsia alpina]CAB3800853.1 Porin B [Pararobbsia alpina]